MWKQFDSISLIHKLVLNNTNTNVQRDTNLSPVTPILVSKDVYEGFKKACPNDNSIKENWWRIDNRHIRDVKFAVYGTDLHWKLD